MRSVSVLGAAFLFWVAVLDVIAVVQLVKALS